MKRRKVQMRFFRDEILNFFYFRFVGNKDFHRVVHAGAGAFEIRVMRFD